MLLYNISLLLPSLFSLWLLHPPPRLPLSLGCYISWSREEHSLCFSSNWMRWAELCQCPHHLLLSRVQEEGGSGESEEEGGRKERGRTELSRCQGLWLGREGSHYPSIVRTGNTGGRRGSVWHTGKVIMTVGVSLGWTNHCFTWLNGDVQKRHRLGQEQSLSVALSSKKEMKAKPWIHRNKMLHLSVCK